MSLVYREERMGSVEASSLKELMEVRERTARLEDHQPWKYRL